MPNDLDSYVDEEPEADGDHYTIDELAAKTGVPSRTIRFYQAKGVLPAPGKRGRVAVYGSAHIERLRVVSDLQDKGLRLRAIRDLVTRPDNDPESIHEWLGLGDHVSGLTMDAPQLMTEDQLRDLLGNPSPGSIGKLIRREAVEVRGEGAQMRYLVNNPQLLRIAGQLEQAGIDVDVAVDLHDILEKRLARAADEVVKYATDHFGKGFGRSEDPKDIKTSLEALFPNLGDALRNIFASELKRAVSERLKGLPGGGKPGNGKRQRRH